MCSRISRSPTVISPFRKTLACLMNSQNTLLIPAECWSLSLVWSSAEWSTTYVYRLQMAFSCILWIVLFGPPPGPLSPIAALAGGTAASRSTSPREQERAAATGRSSRHICLLPGLTGSVFNPVVTRVLHTSAALFCPASEVACAALCVDPFSGRPATNMPAPVVLMNVHTRSITCGRRTWRSGRRMDTRCAGQRRCRLQRPARSY